MSDGQQTTIGLPLQRIMKRPAEPALEDEMQRQGPGVLVEQAASTGAMGQVSMPTLRFTAKQRQREPDTLLNMAPPKKYGIKFVKIRHKARQIQDKQQRKEQPWINDFPGPKDKVWPGDECWIIPILDHYVRVATDSDCQNELQKGFDSLYMVDSSEAQTVTVIDNDSGSKLKEFVEEFASDGKVVRDDLPIRWHTYPADAFPAAVCKKDQAAALLKLLTNHNSGDGFRTTERAKVVT
ncbi:unnamed protein product [Symbiodinium pilosum]|uniref:Uncharacterized protein n=1 Tax=Symbiodinium pilosum TaxID=2952 RepID=A0A812WG44_SYMPI|nr:unnamed protein product [Symbiodinium pilosum]